jgi:uncharacterized secreted protein with C-terminal beta-propeller domain
MERKIKKQSLFYGLTAILLASLLTAMILNFDLIQLDYTPGDLPISAPQSQLLTSFQSDEELKSFLTNNAKNQGPFWIYGAEDGKILAATDAQTWGGTETRAVPSHSATNIQVAGVDEVDSVKVDNRGYMYMVSGSVVYILKAYPPTQAEVIKKLTFDDLYPIGIFVNDNKLAVLGSEYNLPLPFDRYFVADIKTFVKV